MVHCAVYITHCYAVLDNFCSIVNSKVQRDFRSSSRKLNSMLTIDEVRQETLNQLEAKDVLPNTNHTQAPKRSKNVLFVPGDLDHWRLTLTFKLVRARNDTRLFCEFGANPFSGSWEVSYTSKKVADSAKNRTLRSSPRAIKMIAKPTSGTDRVYPRATITHCDR